MSEDTVFKGNIGEVVHIAQPDGRVFEMFRRPPGTRTIVVSPEGKVLITREHRHETKNVDLRLPGGKVCDTLGEYDKLRASGQDMAEFAKTGAIKEVCEETGLNIKDPKLVTVATAGATVDWDLYYFLARDYTHTKDGQQLEHGENIEVTWMSSSEIIAAIKLGQMQEWRSVGVLLGLVLPKFK